MTIKMFKCYSCQNQDGVVVAERDDIRFQCYGFDKQVVRCSKCGLVQLFPNWTDNEREALYSKYSQKQDFSGARRKKTITSYIDNYIKRSDTILEIGCSFGDNLKRLRQNGYNVMGIDKDPTVCDGQDILNYDFFDYVAQGRSFDFIYGIHVLEHIDDPKKFLQQLVKSLKPKGRFLLELPCLDDPLFRLYRIKEFRKFYWYPYHLFFYDKKTILDIFIGLHGFNIQVKSLQRYGLINHLRWLIFRRPGNFNAHVPLLDDIYKYVLTKIFGVSDSLVVLGKKQ